MRTRHGLVNILGTQFPRVFQINARIEIFFEQKRAEVYLRQALDSKLIESHFMRVLL